MNVDWKLWKKAYPFICSICDAGLWEVRETCEACGAKLTIRPMTKSDYNRIKKVDK